MGEDGWERFVVTYCILLCADLKVLAFGMRACHSFRDNVVNDGSIRHVRCIQDQALVHQRFYVIHAIASTCLAASLAAWTAASWTSFNLLKSFCRLALLGARLLLPYLVVD